MGRPTKVFTSEFKLMFVYNYAKNKNKLKKYFQSSFEH